MGYFFCFIIIIIIIIITIIIVINISLESLLAVTTVGLMSNVPPKIWWIR